MDGLTGRAGLFMAPELLQRLDYCCLHFTVHITMLDTAMFSLTPASSQLPVSFHRSP